MNISSLLAIVWLASAISSPVHKIKQGTVKLALYYESYCPYSIEFMNYQLYPVWQEFQDYMEVYLIPFGNAEQFYVDGQFIFFCQHGFEECVGNILHACAVYQACEGNTTLHCAADGLVNAMSYVNCVMRSYDQSESSKKCAKSSSLNESSIEGCLKGELGAILESFYGNVTEAHIHPVVSYTPFIVINGRHNQTEQDAAQLDLRALICAYIPNNNQCNNQPK